MKPAALVSIALSSMALLVPARISAQTVTRGDEARRAVQAFYDAYNTHEFEKLTQFTAEDWTHIAPNGIVRRGRAEALHHAEVVHRSCEAAKVDRPRVTAPAPHSRVAYRCRQDILHQ